MFLVDFDDTLFNTQAFQQERRDVALRMGVSDELWTETYKQARINENGHMVYSDKAHALVLSRHGFDYGEVLAGLEATTERSGQFLFEGAGAFLLELKSMGQPLILLSLGDSDFQEAKVRASRIRHHFDRLFMIPDSKIRVINEIAGATEATGWLINDKIGETAEIVAAHPGLRPILKVSPANDRSEYEKCGWPFFAELQEILEYIKTH